MTRAEANRNAGEGGFTLIEILVVVAIIATLAGLVTILIPKAQSQEQKFNTTNRITMLRTKIDMFRTQYHQYPPATMARLGKRLKNFSGVNVNGTMNECAEVLYLALRAPNFTSKATDSDLGEGSIGNTDEDEFSRAPLGTGTAAEEILDGYGNPIVYIPNWLYTKGPMVITLQNGEEVEVEAMKKPDGTYYNQNSFQLISVGADGQQDPDPTDPAADDLTNFPIKGRD